MKLYRGRYSTPFGKSWRSVKAQNKDIATTMLKNKTPYWKGWVLEEVIAA